MAADGGPPHSPPPAQPPCRPGAGAERERGGAPARGAGAGGNRSSALSRPRGVGPLPGAGERGRLFAPTCGAEVPAESNEAGAAHSRGEARPSQGPPGLRAGPGAGRAPPWRRGLGRPEQGLGGLRRAPAPSRRPLMAAARSSGAQVTRAHSWLLVLWVPRSLGRGLPPRPAPSPHLLMAAARSSGALFTRDRSRQLLAPRVPGSLGRGAWLYRARQTLLQAGQALAGVGRGELQKD